MDQTCDSLTDARAVHAKGYRLDCHSSRSSYREVGHIVNVVEIDFGASLRELSGAEASVLEVLLQ